MTEGAKTNGIIEKYVRDSVPGVRVRVAEDCLAGLGWIERNCAKCERRRKEKDVVLSAASAVLVPSFQVKNSWLNCT